MTIELPKDFGAGGNIDQVAQLVRALVNEHNQLLAAFAAHTHKSENGTRNTSTPQTNAPSSGNEAGTSAAITPSIEVK